MSHKVTIDGFLDLMVIRDGLVLRGQMERLADALDMDVLCVSRHGDPTDW